MFVLLVPFSALL